MSFFNLLAPSYNEEKAKLFSFLYFSFSGSPSFIKGRCPGNNATVFNQTNSFATAPIISLNGRSFTISCWIKQIKWVRDQFGAIYGDWHRPWQFLLSSKNQRIAFQRHSTGSDEWPYLESNILPLRNWTHVAVTWQHATGILVMYADGKVIGQGSYENETFYGPTGVQYKIGEDGHSQNHQFYGSVMDLYVFGKALSLDEVNRLRGLRFMIL